MILQALSLIALSLPSLQGPEPTTRARPLAEKVRLQSATASWIVRQLITDNAMRHSTHGESRAETSCIHPIPRVIGYDLDNSIILIGTDRERDDMHSRILLLDVPRGRIMVELQTLQLLIESSGSWRVRQLGEPTTVVLSDSPAGVFVNRGGSAWEVMVDLRLKADGTIWAKGALDLENGTDCKRSVPFGKRIDFGSSILAGVTVSGDEQIADAVATGGIPLHGAPLTAIYLQARAYLPAEPTPGFMGIGR